jgi:glycosyltransferase involved in cell wall biosynthesis
VAQSGVNPLLHYIKHGVEEGTNPSPYFDTRWYWSEYPDVAHHSINPLAHYIEHAIEEGRNPNPHFDTRWYLNEYPHVAQSGVNPLLHYIKHGVEEGTNPNPYFDTRWYLNEYQDVARSGINPLLHYLKYGIKERRNPNSYFDTRCYLNDYLRWIWQFDTLNEEDKRIIKQHIQNFNNPPLLSVLMPVYNPPPHCLDEAIWSVRNQLYPYWELCIADDASTDHEIRNVLERHATADQRIKIVYRHENGHISRALNSALELAMGEFIALLDHEDILSEHALFWVAEAIQQHPDAGLIYSDEDKIDMEGNRIDPYFKCDWNPFLFLGHNMICHLGVFRTALVRELGGFRVGYEGSQDYDLATRTVETLNQGQIIHIPRILYHWRVISESTAGDTSEKPYALIASEKVINEHLERQNLRGKVAGVPSLGCMHRITFELPEKPPLVSILIPTRNGEKLVYQCIESITKKTKYRNYEIVLIDNGSDSPAALTYFSELAKNPRIRVFRDDSPFNFSRLNNRAAENAKGEVLVLLNNDTEVVTPEWLDEMISLAMLPNIGAVGARLCYPNGTLQHGGVILGLGGCAAHAHSCVSLESAGYFGRAKLLQMITAVTGACLAVRKSVFQEVGGLDEEKLKISYNDIDFCLKLRGKGYWNVWTPHAELIHYESVTRGYEVTPERKARFFNEISTLKKRWPNSFFHDPAYNPNLTFNAADFSLSKRPRIALGSAHQPKLFSQSFIAPPTIKPRLLIATSDQNSTKKNRICEFAESLCRQGFIESYVIADRLGFAYASKPSQGWFDAICLQGDPSGIRWFQDSVMRSLPYLADWNDASGYEAFTSDKETEEIKQSFVHSGSISVSNLRLLRQIEKKTNLDLEYCTSVTPDGVPFPEITTKLEKPRGLIWRYDDFVMLVNSREQILRAVNEFSIKYELPVYCVGNFPKEINKNLNLHISINFNDMADYYSFLQSSGTLIGIASLETNDIKDALDANAYRSDLRMVEYGGFGIPGIYSASPPYLETDLQTGRVVENTFEAWRDALEWLYTEGYQVEEENSIRIRELRSIDRLARECWWPVLKKVLLNEPVPASAIKE